MRTVITTAAIISICAIQAGAADTVAIQQGAGQNVAQKKTEIIHRIEQRIALSQQEKSCVQAAQSDNEFKACREKFRPPQPNGNGNRNHQTQ